MKQSTIWSGNRSLLDVSRRLKEIKSGVISQSLFIAVWTLIWLVGGVSYTLSLREEYVSNIKILLQPHKIYSNGTEFQKFNDQFLSDSLQCDTEMEIILSQTVLRRVFRILNIENTSEASDEFQGLSNSIRGILRSPLRSSENAKREIAFERFSERVKTRRIGLSYVLDISYIAYDRVMAKKVANSIAAVYIENRLRDRAWQSGQDGAFLLAQEKSMKQQIEGAEKATRDGFMDSDIFPDSAVRILGPASSATMSSYPKSGFIILNLVLLGYTSGVLMSFCIRNKMTIEMTGGRYWVKPSHF